MPPDLSEREILERLAATLTARQLDVFLRRAYNWSYQAIAEEMGITPQGAHRIHAQALAKTRKIKWEAENDDRNPPA